MPETHGAEAASPWVARFAGLVPAGGAVLDLACGRGRHARLFAASGHPVLALDRDADALAELADVDRIETRCADLEDGSPWPPGGRRFAGVIVANYLHRPLLPAIVEAVGAGGALIYETFAAGNERFGRPRSPDFLLNPGELLEAVRGRLRIVAFEDGETATPRPAMVQRICAVNAAGDTALPRLLAG